MDRTIDEEYSRIDLQKQKLEQFERELKGWAQLRRILEAQQWQEWPSGDIIIKIRRNAMVGCTNPGEIPLEACDVSVAPHEYDAKKSRLIHQGE